MSLCYCFPEKSYNVPAINLFLGLVKLINPAPLASDFKKVFVKTEYIVPISAICVLP